MKYRHIFLCVLLFHNIGKTVYPQDRYWAEVSGGYSYLRISPTPGLKYAQPNVDHKSAGLNGWSVAGTVFFARRAGITFEFSRHYGEVPGFDTHYPGPPVFDIGFNNMSFLVGPRFKAFESKRLVVSLSALVGLDSGEQSEYVCCLYDGGLSHIDFGASFGGSIDLKLNERFAIRLIQPTVYLLSGAFGLQGGRATTANLLISSGLAFRFGRK